MKQSTSYRLTQQAIKLLEAMANSLGISQTAMLEIMIREEAKRRGVSMPEVDQGSPPPSQETPKEQ